MRPMTGGLDFRSNGSFRIQARLLPSHRSPMRIGAMAGGVTGWVNRACGSRTRPRSRASSTTPTQLASVLVRLGHHRVREHREDRTRRERENEGDGVRRRVLEEAVAGERGEPRDQRDRDPHPEDRDLLPAAAGEAAGRGDRLGQVGDEDRAPGRRRRPPRPRRSSGRSPSTRGSRRARFRARWRARSRSPGRRRRPCADPRRGGR